MTTLEIDRATIARKRAQAESLELQARRLRQDASEIEQKLLINPRALPRIRGFAKHCMTG